MPTTDAAKKTAAVTHSAVAEVLKRREKSPPDYGFIACDADFAAR